MDKQNILLNKIKEYGDTCFPLDKEKECEQLRSEFLKAFPIEKLKDMTLMQYALGTENYKNSFCYWIENRLNCLGNIHGATSSKFAVYYGKKKPDSHNEWRWSKWTNNDFSIIRAELIKLIEAGKEKDCEAIKNNKLSPMFKGKILAIYFPEDYINVFSYEHIKYFLQKVFNVYYYPPQFEALSLLLQEKQKDQEMKKWSNLKMSYFLYTAFPDVKYENKTEINQNTPTIIGEKLIPLMHKGEYQPIFSAHHKTSVDDDKENPKHDYEKIAKHNASIGRAGEKAVFEYEKERLKASGRSDLADKVEWVADSTDSKGYDIKSYNEDGTEKHIEVKTNVGSETEVSFYISSFEYEKLKTDSAYEIYYVFGKKNKKIYHVDCKQLIDRFNELSSPISYKVGFKTTDIL